MREWPESFLRGKAHIQILLIVSMEWKDPRIFQELMWFQGTALAKDGHAMAFVGTPREEEMSLIHKLQEDGWSTVSHDVVRMNVKTGYRPSLSTTRSARGRVLSCSLIFINHSSQSEPSLRPCSPSAAVGELLSHCVRFFRIARKRLGCCVI